MDAEFCVAALPDTLARFGKSDIFNTDQGSHFTSADFTGVLLEAGIRISMDGIAPHSALAGSTPDEVYGQAEPDIRLAA